MPLVLSLAVLALQPAGPQPAFDDAAEAAGLVFTYENGMSGELYLPEIIGGGAALLDCDADGDLDVFLAQGGSLTREPSRGAPAGVLYQNQWANEEKLAFRDVTSQSGLAGRSFGMGAMAADLDGDGLTDLYVLSLGANRFFRNEGDCRFSDQTERSGLGDQSWSIAASPLDYDRDGDLDVYVVNYLDFTLYRHRTCESESAARDYCGPLTFPGQTDRLYRNEGDGRFEEVTREAGVLAPDSRGMAATAADFDGDGLLDLFVANDQMANHLWLNQGNGTFTDGALLGGVALNERGQVEASMGVEAADFDQDGDEDLFISNLTGETSTLYLGDGSGLFTDSTATSGIASASFPYAGFGTVALDYDGDGCLDLAVANGAIKAVESQARAEDPYPLRQPNQLFRCVRDTEGGALRFEDVSGRLPRALSESVSRGLAVGDLDNDGDPDLVLVESEAPTRLLLNRASRGPWVGATLRSSQSAPQGLGSRVSVAGERTWRRARVDGSYASSNDPRVLLRLGSATDEVTLRVQWTSGRVEDFQVPAERYAELVEGAGKVVTDAVSSR